MNADRLTEIRGMIARGGDSHLPTNAETRLALTDVLAALAAAEQRAKAAQDRLDEVVKDHDLYWRARAEKAEQERDEWQELAVRLAEEAGVDAEQMLAQARAAALTTHHAEAKP